MRNTEWLDKIIDDELITDTNATIEKLQAALFKCGEDAVEIENYKKIAERQQSLSMDRGFEIKRLKEDIERLQSMNQAKLDIIHDLRTDLETARAEAVKEFAEMVKEKIRTMSRIVVYDEDIEHLVIEFTEGEQK